MKKWVWIVVVTAAVLAAAGASMAQRAPAASPLKVGAIFAVTGPASWLGQPEKNTVLMLEEQINAAGGINGRPLKVIVEDTEGDETKAVLAIKKLIYRDEVLAVIGPSRSGTTLAVIPIAEEAQIPLISCAAAETITTPLKKWVFQTPQKDADAVRRIYEHMNKSGISKIGIITVTSGFGMAGREQLKSLAPASGIEIVADETYGPGDTDMTAQLDKIKASGAKAVVNWSIEPAQVIVPKNMRQLGMKIPLYQSHGFGNVKYAEAAGEAGEGIIFPAGRLLAVDTLADDHPQKALLARYKANYEAKFKEDVSTFGGHAYDALMLVVEALQAGGPDKEKIRSYIENKTGFIGTGGIFNFSPESHYGLDPKAFAMLTVKNGKFVVLEP